MTIYTDQLPGSGSRRSLFLYVAWRRYIADSPEDDRITKIGEAVMAGRKTVGFVTDTEEGKADRYISKLQKQFPGIRVIDRSAGPVAYTVLVRVGPPLQ